MRGALNPEQEAIMTDTSSIVINQTSPTLEDMDGPVNGVHYFDPTNAPPAGFLPVLNDLFAWVLKYSYGLEHPNYNHPTANNLGGVNKSEESFYWFMFYAASNLMDMSSIHGLCDIARELKLLSKHDVVPPFDVSEKVVAALSEDLHIVLSLIDKPFSSNTMMGETVSVFNEATSIALWRLNRGI